MSWKKRAVLLTTLSCLSVICSATENPTQVPFKLYRGYAIVVRGSIGGLKNLNLLVDTGAVPGVLDARIARKLHLRGQAEQVDVQTGMLPTERVTAPNVEVGPTHAAELSMIVRDLHFAGEALGTTVDAMIGFDLLSQSPFTIDYEARKIIFGPVDPSLVTVSYSPGLGYAIVPLQIQGQTLGILVDTGASNLVLFPTGVRHCGPAIHILGWETWTNMGGEIPVAKAQLVDAYLGGVPWGNRPVYIPENSANNRSGLAGLLGTVALGKRVAFDPVRNIVAWAQK